ncbi:hypothetical protein EAY27_13725 [Vibrio anguillarum]|uniref:helix-turn-helix transcriptional regulator n=3 Tax=Vibrio anguillarum TaxID=55601 RepID=UPI00188A9D4F|nr:hypothetical protein [Vibrio anguillarum]HDZ9326759.1 hypothetical protein [Vibrio cholerae]MBF4237617.1 hypothetical protein [Vibrio anguillarum]MBF4256852.1 hypothetical protein [Vibrio anguillarum]MBF4278235.1 hypothetical protein [Vibrio anguillarum]MBF4298780.1 hypothetical protein [Vibrio anguillarum]
MTFTDAAYSNYTFNYQAPSFLPRAETAENNIYDSTNYPESSNSIMSHKEVLDFFQKSRTTIIQWRKERGFPEPISKSPLRWLRCAVMEWVEHQGGFKRMS